MKTTISFDVYANASSAILYEIIGNWEYILWEDKLKVRDFAREKAAPVKEENRKKYMRKEEKNLKELI